MLNSVETQGAHDIYSTGGHMGTYTRILTSKGSKLKNNLF